VGCEKSSIKQVGEISDETLASSIKQSTQQRGKGRREIEPKSERKKQNQKWITKRKKEQMMF
jgi:hypothetical protein